jgi:hypothetical protein
VKNFVISNYVDFTTILVYLGYVNIVSYAVAQLVEALRRKVAGSIPDGAIGIFHWHNLSGRNMALGLTQPLTGVFPGDRRGRCIGLTTLPLSCADCLEIWEPEPPGTLRVCPGLQWNFFTST